MALDAGRDAEANATAMTAAGRAVQTLQVTEAVRDATVSGKKVKKGQTIVLDPDDGLRRGRTPTAIGRCSRRSPAERRVSSCSRIYYGDGATLADAEALARQIGDAHPAIEEERRPHGGQPHYRYLIAAE